jgi:nucleoside-diphosphate-sugar epimerase
MKIVVIGGGVLGAKLVTWLREHDHRAVAASPQDGVDLLTGDGLARPLTHFRDWPSPASHLEER